MLVHLNGFSSYASQHLDPQLKLVPCSPPSCKHSSRFHQPAKPAEMLPAYR